MAVGLDPHAARISPPPATGTPPAREASPTGLSGARSEIQENSSDNSSQESLCTCISRIISQLWAIIRQCFCGATGGDTTTTEEATRTATPTQGSQITGDASSPSNPTATEEPTRTATPPQGSQITGDASSPSSTTATEEPTRTATPPQGSQITGDASSPSSTTATEEATRTMTPAQGSQITGDASSPSNPTATEEATRTTTPPQGSQITGSASSPSNPTATREAAYRIPLAKGLQTFMSNYLGLIAQKIGFLQRGVVFMVITHNNASKMSCALVSSPEEQTTFIRACLQELKKVLAQDGNCNDGALAVTAGVVMKNLRGSLDLDSVNTSTKCGPDRVQLYFGDSGSRGITADNIWLCLQPTFSPFDSEGVEVRTVKEALRVLSEG